VHEALRDCTRSGDRAADDRSANRLRPRRDRLTRYGLDLVRAGKLTARDLVWGSLYTSVDMQETTWAEPTVRWYEPSHYAVFIPEEVYDRHVPKCLVSTSCPKQPRSS
jgi:hypothetical protein